MQEYNHLPTSRPEAKKLNSTSYFTGKMCKNGHIDKRWTNDGSCNTCKKRFKFPKEYFTNWWKENKDKAKLYHTKQKPQRIARQKYDRQNNPKRRLRDSIAGAIYKSLKNLCKNKSFKRWETFVKFSFLDLKLHLENQFDENMTWENYGTYWHLDHIKPITLCSSFEEAWELNNLQPLEASKNRSKGNRYIG